MKMIRIFTIQLFTFILLIHLPEANALSNLPTKASSSICKVEVDNVHFSSFLEKTRGVYKRKAFETPWVMSKKIEPICCGTLDKLFS